MKFALCTVKSFFFEKNSTINKYQAGCPQLLIALHRAALYFLKPHYGCLTEVRFSLLSGESYSEILFEVLSMYFPSRAFLACFLFATSFN